VFLFLPEYISTSPAVCVPKKKNTQTLALSLSPSLSLSLSLSLLSLPPPLSLSLYSLYSVTALTFSSSQPSVTRTEIIGLCEGKKSLWILQGRRAGGYREGERVDTGRGERGMRAGKKQQDFFLDT
jgi:hypothetical protein